jgi:predicted small secreted protein
LRSRSTIIRFSARSFSLASCNSRQRGVGAGVGGARAGALDRLGFDAAAATSRKRSGEEDRMRTAGWFR